MSLALRVRNDNPPRNPRPHGWNRRPRGRSTAPAVCISLTSSLRCPFASDTTLTGALTRAIPRRPAPSVPGDPPSPPQQRQSAEHVDLARVVTATGAHGVAPRFHLGQRVYLARHTVTNTLTVATTRRVRKAVDAARAAAAVQVRRARGVECHPGSRILRPRMHPNTPALTQRARNRETTRRFLSAQRRSLTSCAPPASSQRGLQHPTTSRCVRVR